MAKYISKHVGGKIVKALGLSGVKDFSLHFPMGGVPTIKLEMILSDAQQEAAASIIESEGVKAGKPEGGTLKPQQYFVGEGPAEFLVDSRGADPEAIKRLEASIRKMGDSIEKRAIGLVKNERSRAPGASMPSFWSEVKSLFRFICRRPMP